MWGIVCLFISSVLFIHLGMGEAIEKVLRIRFILLRCAKCLTFWTTAGYSLIIFSHSVEVSLCIGFACAYAALRADLLLGTLAIKYEKLTQSMDAKEPQSHPATHRNTQNKGHSKKAQVP
jgi:hypothetical protein